MREGKNRLRRDYGEQLWKFTENEHNVHQSQRKLIKHLSSLSFWKFCPLTAAFQALKGEPCLDSFYKAQANSAFAFPVLDEKTGGMEFYIPENPNSFRKGAGSFFEPDPEHSRKVSPEEIKVFLIPGRAFDRNGGRLGRGRACYDKYLKQTAACKVGVAWGLQIHEGDLPLEAHDIFMDFIVTERFVLIPDTQRVEKLDFKKKEAVSNG